MFCQDITFSLRIFFQASLLISVENNDCVREFVSVNDSISLHFYSTSRFSTLEKKDVFIPIKGFNSKTYINPESYSMPHK